MKIETVAVDDHPTGLCIGWHSLDEDEYKKALEEWKERENQKINGVLNGTTC